MVEFGRGGLLLHDILFVVSPQPVGAAILSCTAAATAGSSFGMCKRGLLCRRSKSLSTDLSYLKSRNRRAHLSCRPHISTKRTFLLGLTLLGSTWRSEIMNRTVWAAESSTPTPLCAPSPCVPPEEADGEAVGSRALVPAALGQHNCR